MRSTAGFSSRGGHYYIPRAEEETPEILLQQVWPALDMWDQRFTMRLKGKGWAQGGLDEDDIAGQGFLQLLRQLRVILLQDLAILQQDFPQLLLFTSSLFEHPLWPPFAEKVRLSVLGKEGDRSLLLEQALPELSEVVYGCTDNLYTQEKHQHSKTQMMLSKLQGDLDYLSSVLSGQNSSTCPANRPARPPLPPPLLLLVAQG
jgi:Centromere DNA-binding protein complex CBF3 subunit, domain 2